MVEAAAELIGALPADEVPVPLRRFARFERRKRAKLAGQHIAADLWPAKAATGDRDDPAEAWADPADLQRRRDSYPQRHHNFKLWRHGALQGIAHRRGTSVTFG